MYWAPTLHKALYLKARDSGKNASRPQTQGGGALTWVGERGAVG